MFIRKNVTWIINVNTLIMQQEYQLRMLSRVELKEKNVLEAGNGVLI
jgi:hypothetical protein